MARASDTAARRPVTWRWLSDRWGSRVGRRVRWPTVIVTAAAVVVVLGSIILLHAASRPAQSAVPGGSGGTIAWINAPASQARPATASACQAGALRIALGRVGVWQGDSVQVLDVTNTTGMPCSFSAQGLSVIAVTPAGNRVDVDTATTVQDSIRLAGGETVHVGIGAPADCGSTATIARTLEVTVAGGPAHDVDKAWVPVNCGRPSVVQVNVEHAPEAPEPLTATLHAPASATAGSTLRFTVTLSNTSASEPVTFAHCPSYYTGLKVAHVDEGHQLNCEVNPDLAPGESRTYEMQLTVPAGTAGSDLLTWELGGHEAADSIPIDVHHD